MVKSVSLVADEWSRATPRLAVCHAPAPWPQAYRVRVLTHADTVAAAGAIASPAARGVEGG